MKKLFLLVMFIMLNAGNIQNLQNRCENGDGKSCFYLGFFYQAGEGVKQDYFKAKQYLGKACDLGYQGGCKNYAILNK